MTKETQIRKQQFINELSNILKKDLAYGHPLDDIKIVLQNELDLILNRHSAFLYFIPKEAQEFNLKIDTYITLRGIQYQDSVTVKNFKHLIEFFFKCDWKLIISKSKKDELVAVRRYISLWLKENTRWSLKEIGIFLGGRDHSTIIYAIETVEGYIKLEKDTNYLWKEFNEFINFYTKNSGILENLKLNSLEHD